MLKRPSFFHLLSPRKLKTQTAFVLLLHLALITFFFFFLAPTTNKEEEGKEEDGQLL
jgi:hypothetical protein